MAGLLDALKQYIADAAPGGLLNQEQPKMLSDLLNYGKTRGKYIGGLLGDAASTGAQAYGSASGPLAPQHARTLGGLLADFTPVVGDVKSAYDGIQSAREGDYLGAGLGALGALPMVPNLGGVIKAYHGSPVAGKIKELKGSAGGELGPGFYITKERDYAAGYKMPKGEDRAQAPGVIGLDIEPLNIKEIDRKGYLDARAKLMDEYRANNGGEWDAAFFDKAQQKLMQDYMAQGHKGIYDAQWRQGVIFPEFLRNLPFSLE